MSHPHDNTLLYTPDPRGGALRLRQLAAALKRETVTPPLHTTCRSDFLVWLSILSDMLMKYETLSQFEREFPQDLILSRRRNHANMKRFETFFSLDEENHTPGVALFYPAAGDSPKAPPRMLPLLFLLSEPDNYNTPNP